jgi:KDO2-lipid IV(A) lauroyltransferase
LVKLFTCLSVLLWKIPAPLLDAAGAFLGLTIHYVFPYRKKLVRFQMQKVFPSLSVKETNKLVRKNYIHYGKLLVEFILLLRLKPGSNAIIDSHFKCDSLELLKDSLKDGRGAILTGSHTGLWEAIGPFLSRNGLPVTVTVKRVNSPLFQRLREIFQAHPGVSILDPALGNKRALYLLKALRNNSLAGIFLDQYRSREPLIPFLGHEARTNSTAAVLYRKTSVPVFVIHVIRKRIGDYSVEIKRIEFPSIADLSDMDAIKAISTTINNELSSVIYKWPEQWLWAHRRFKDNPLFNSIN